MPQKGGGGQQPPQDIHEPIRTTTTPDGPLPGSLDRFPEIDPEEDEPDFVYGDIVVDEREAEPEDLVVVNVPRITADRWVIDGETLADRHPECPPSDDVVIVVPLVALEDYDPAWREREEDIPLSELKESPLAPVVYPGLRLDLVEPSHLRD